MITSPNTNYVPESHIFEDEDLRPRADGRFGLVDCFQWPQIYELQHAYAVCIPRQDTLPSLKVVWYTPTSNDFEVLPGSKSAVGTLRQEKITSFEELLQVLRSRGHHIRKRCDVLKARMRTAEHDVTRLCHHPLVFRDLVAFVAQLQRTLLDIHALLDYHEILHPLLVTPPTRPVTANPTWMGCFTKDTQVCESLFFAGVPVWLVRNKAFISPTMNIIRPVRLTYPDDIVKAMFTENGVAKPFPVIYRGPAGFNRHMNSHRQYEGNLTEEPGPVASSSQLPSRSGKQPTKSRLGLHRNRPP